MSGYLGIGGNVEDGATKTLDGRDLYEVRTQLWGNLWAPETLAELAFVVEVLTAPRHNVVWRGQADNTWPLDSSGVQRLVNTGLAARDAADLDSRVYRYEVALIERARHAGYDIHGGQRLSDLELLALLRHHGAATRLLDFSCSFFVALWFACEDPHDAQTCGVVVGLAGLSAPSHYQVNQSLYDCLRTAPGSPTWAWEPWPIAQRIVAQRSALVFGELKTSRWGTVDARDDQLLAIAVIPRLKACMRRHWTEVFGFDPTVVYPDVAGFAQHHRKGNADRVSIPGLARIIELDSGKGRSDGS